VITPSTKHTETEGSTLSFTVTILEPCEVGTNQATYSISQPAAVNVYRDDTHSAIDPVVWTYTPPGTYDSVTCPLTIEATKSSTATDDSIVSWNSGTNQWDVGTTDNKDYSGVYTLTVTPSTENGSALEAWVLTYTILEPCDTP